MEEVCAWAAAVVQLHLQIHDHLCHLLLIFVGDQLVTGNAGGGGGVGNRDRELQCGGSERGG